MGTPARYYSSTAVITSLTGSITELSTEMIVGSESGFPSSYPFTLIIEKDTANEEIVTVTGKVGGALQISRGLSGGDGTAARPHSAGASVEHGLIAKDLTDFRAHEAAAANVHDIGAGASVVGTTTTQTISNKTLGSNLAAGGFKVTGLADPTSAQDAATKNWAETGMSSQLVQATTQATNAAASASTASTKASEASASASSASSSASAANTSASNASSSAASAATQAASSAASATLANDWATKTSSTVAGGEWSAKYHAQQASTSATNASTSASTASTKASEAATSALSASTSASDATSAKTAAQAAQAAAETALDSFDDRYLGAKASDPSVDNDGNALLTGALYFNTAVNAMKQYSGSSWSLVTSATICTSTTRPSSPFAGQIIYETDSMLFFGWNGSAWLPVGGGAKGGGTDDVFFENSQTVNTNYTITSGKNAVSAGPVTIASGVSVTIPSGSVWVIV